MAAARVAFRAGVDVAGADRLLTTHKVSIIQPLPRGYGEKIAAVAGVVAVTHSSWFGGIYQNPNTGFQGVFQNPVEPEAYLAMYPEFLVPEDEKRAWIADREGVLVGRRTAERYGWKVGDRVPVLATIYRKKDGARTWEFNVRGIYDGREKGTDTTQFLFHYDYYDKQLFTYYFDQVFGALQKLANVPKSRVDGAELELQFTPASVSGLFTSVGVTFLDTEVKEYTGLGPFGEPDTDYAGSELTFSPAWEVNAVVNWLYPAFEWASIVVGGDGKVLASELVPEITTEPDYAKVTAALG